MKIASSFQVPDCLEFGYCRVGTPENQTFTIVNTSSTVCRYGFASEIFELSPRQGKRCIKISIGTLQPNQKAEITVTYKAEEAKTVVEAVRLNINEEEWRTVKMTAIGKYPYISLSTHKLDFGELLAGLSITKEVILKNPSLVPAEFVVEKEEADKDVLACFALDYTKSTIPPNSSFLIKVKYSPFVVNLYSCTHFKVKVKGGNEEQLNCTGQALGVEVGLSAKSIQFGEVTYGNTTNRVLHIHNYSSQAATFQFINDRKNVFSFSKKEGVIKPHSDFRIVITFCPTDTINFYERIFCIVKNHIILVSEIYF